MSGGEGEPATVRDEVWLEQYRPQRLEDVVGQDAITERLQTYVDQNDLSHLLFAGPAGVGKTTSALAIARELYGEDWEQHFLELNASDERGIDVIRERVKSFARTAFGGAEYRIIFLDEADALCVPPGTEVVTGYPSAPEVKPIEDVDPDGEPIPSVDFETNEIQSDTGKRVDSGVADFFEVELDDGRTIQASLTHPFFVVGEDGRLVETELRELSPGDEIADFKEQIGVSRCEVCGAWTTGRYCSVECKDEGHSREMRGEGNPMYGTEWSERRREKIVQALSDGRLSGENNPNYGGEFHGVSIWEMDTESINEFRQQLSELRSGTSWDEWATDADADAVKEQIQQTMSDWWEELDEARKTKLIEKSTENCEYPVADISGDNNPMRDPEVPQKVSEALQGHEPTGGGNIRYSEELGHIVRSDWEYEVATALRDAGIDYEYEPKFELSDSVYHPDFIIGDSIIEVKGSAELWGQTEKVEEFLETYGDEYRFIVVGDGALPHNEHYEREEFDPGIVADGGASAVRTATIRDIEYSHRGEAYNISMDGTPNFMLANGILTHNTSDAQAALRRTMEQFSDNVRFILSCNYSSQIIDPIQSRCTVFRFSPLSDAAVATQVRKIADAEGIELTEDGVDALTYVAGGDMRAAINGLQAAATAGTVDEEAVFEITSTARPEDIEEMVTLALDNDFTAARSQLDRLLTEEGIAGGDVIDQLHRSVWEFDLGEKAAVRTLDRIGEADYRITVGANERIQLEALLASLALENSD